ncbi:MAG: phosphotransferase, partial [Dehalococcoidales bacterium]|nr:phosphotransferase [Dehalococcoidales bacterium]
MPELPELVQALLDPKAYPDSPSGVALIQTQMSFVLLTDRYVYKIKKPVNLGYLDYTTLEKRHFYCQREVKLNRRLCPDAYLGVLPITRQGNSFSIDGSGKVIEYAVKMRRLPQSNMLDELLKNNRVSPEMMISIARKVADFHRHAETNANISSFGDLKMIIQNTEENFTQTEKYFDRIIPQPTYSRIRDYTHAFIQENTPLFLRRVAEKRIRDCHGDLHAAHICFTDGVCNCIYDCIEFNDRFRYSDVASEVAFLAMDLDHYRRADLSHSFINAYVDESQDKELLSLLNFYKCYRAYVR